MSDVIQDTLTSALQQINAHRERELTALDAQLAEAIRALQGSQAVTAELSVAQREAEVDTEASRALAALRQLREEIIAQVETVAEEQAQLLNEVDVTSLRAIFEAQVEEERSEVNESGQHQIERVHELTQQLSVSVSGAASEGRREVDRALAETTDLLMSTGARAEASVEQAERAQSATLERAEDLAQTALRDHHSELEGAEQNTKREVIERVEASLVESTAQLREAFNREEGELNQAAERQTGQLQERANSALEEARERMDVAVGAIDSRLREALSSISAQTQQAIQFANTLQADELGELKSLSDETTQQRLPSALKSAEDELKAVGEREVAELEGYRAEAQRQLEETERPSESELRAHADRALESLRAESTSATATVSGQARSSISEVNAAVAEGLTQLQTMMSAQSAALDQAQDEAHETLRDAFSRPAKEVESQYAHEFNELVSKAQSICETLNQQSRASFERFTQETRSNIETLSNTANNLITQLAERGQSMVPSFDGLSEQLADEYEQRLTQQLSYIQELSLNKLNELKNQYADHSEALVRSVNETKHKLLSVVESTKYDLSSLVKLIEDELNREYRDMIIELGDEHINVLSSLVIAADSSQDYDGSLEREDLALEDAMMYLRDAKNGFDDFDDLDYERGEEFATWGDDFRDSQNALKFEESNEQRRQQIERFVNNLTECLSLNTSLNDKIIHMLDATIQVVDDTENKAVSQIIEPLKQIALKINDGASESIQGLRGIPKLIEEHRKAIFRAATDGEYEDISYFDKALDP